MQDELLAAIHVVDRHAIVHSDNVSSLTVLWNAIFCCVEAISQHRVLLFLEVLLNPAPNFALQSGTYVFDPKDQRLDDCNETKAPCPSFACGSATRHIAFCV